MIMINTNFIIRLMIQHMQQIYLEVLAQATL